MNPFEDESSVRALEKERRYRNYSADMEKILRQFENTSDWADTIPLLVRLTKTILANRQYESIPHKLMLCKRLAQCLHQNMPSGVHEKTLECYSAVLSCVQRTDLKNNLHLYLFGVLPLFAYCGSTIRLPLISLYEEFVLPLGPALRPCLPGLLLALLPGMEETSDHVDRVGQLLRSICQAVSRPVFFTGLWRVLYDSPSVRLTGLNFVLACYDKRKSLDDQDDLMGQVLGNLMDSLCAVLADHNTLVQRQALEFLLNAFPLSASRLGNDDLSRLCAAAFNILLKRDASLNRRFYAWLLGNSGASGGAGNQEETSSYSSYSLGIGSGGGAKFVGRLVCIAAYKLFAKQKANDPIPAFRVLQSLIERAVVGQQIVSDTLLTALRLWRDAPNPDEAAASIGHLLSSLDGAFLCRFFSDLLASDWSSCEELCSLAHMAHARCLANDWTPLLLKLLRLAASRLADSTPSMLEAAIRLASDILTGAASEPLDSRIVRASRLVYLRICQLKLGLTDDVLSKAPAKLLPSGATNLTTTTMSSSISRETDLSVSLADTGAAFGAALESLLVLLGRVAACPLRQTKQTDLAEHDEYKDDEEENSGRQLPAPRWVLALVVSSCFVRDSRIRHPSTRALLELLAAAQCLSANDANAFPEASDSTQNYTQPIKSEVVAVTFPTLPPSTLTWLQNGRLYSLLGEALWSDLAPDAEPTEQRASASLFAELCQSVPEICEDLLLHKLGSELADQSDAHRRFTSMWLMMKPDRAPELPRCLLALLHFVGSGSTLEKLVVDWAEHAMRMGQLPRLLNPLLALLLCPNAARLSVDRIAAAAADETAAKNGSHDGVGGTSRWDVEESRIVGIESDGTGKVIYRINQSPSRTDLANSLSASSGTLSAANTRKLPASAVKQPAVQLLATARSAAPVRVSSANTLPPFRLRINPLDDQTDTDAPELNRFDNNAEYVDEDTGGKDFNACDDFVSSYNSTTGGKKPSPVPKSGSTGVLCPNPDAVAAVNDILEELITGALALVERSVHPLFSHMCLYNRRIDCLQVSYVLSRLLALLAALPQLFTSKLAGTQLLSAKSPGSYQVLALFLRHRACVDGANFFQDPPHQLHKSYKSVTYLHLLTSLALDYARSCYSPYARERVETSELIGNRLVQTRAADLLCNLVACAASGDSPEAARQLRDNRLQLGRLSLHCLCSALAACYSHWTVDSHVFSAKIVQFNEAGVDWLARSAHVKSLARLTLRLLALMRPGPVAAAGGGGEAGKQAAAAAAAANGVSDFVYQDRLPLSGQPLLMLALRLGLGPASLNGGDHVTWYGFVSDLLPHCAGSHLGQVVTLTTGCLCDTLSIRETPAPPDLQPMALTCLYVVLDRALRARDVSAHRCLPRLLPCLLRYPTKQGPVRRILHLIVSEDLNLLLTAAATAKLQEDNGFVEALMDLVPLRELLIACKTNQAALMPTVCVAKRMESRALASHSTELQAVLRESLPGSRSEVPFLQLELFHAFLLALKDSDRDSRGRRDLQDLAGVLVASVLTILGSTAERQSWFRVSVACTEEEVAYSSRAARLLEQAMFLLLDHVFGPNGDRAEGLLTGPVLRAALPHLKLKPHPAVFDACSGLLRELSRKEYTRRSWKKEVSDLLLESTFFKMPLATLRCWVDIVDNLMATEFKQAFRDIFPRLTVSTTTNPFSSRDQEWDQRSAMVKRLAFLIYCGEPDQYLPQLQDVVAYLTENLRVSTAGHLHAAVMLCFRVMLLRISAPSLAPLWYVFVPEIYSALWQLEQEAEPHRLPQSRLDLYLAVFKLLDACVQLDESQAAMFHAYKWSLVGDPEDAAPVTSSASGGIAVFSPLVNRVCRRLCQLLSKAENGFAQSNNNTSNANMPQQPVHSCCQRLNLTRLESLLELLPFLVAFVDRYDLGRPARLLSAGQPMDPTAACVAADQLPCSLHSCDTTAQREELLLMDFMEPA